MRRVALAALALVAAASGGAAVPVRAAAAGGAGTAGGAVASERSAAPGAAVVTDGAGTVGVAAVTGGAAGTPTDAVAERRAEHDYLLGCAGCHGLDAAGSARVPSLRGVDRLLARPGGRAYVLRVPGVASAPLSDARLAALLDWVFARFGNHAEPHFTAEEVGTARLTPWVDPKRARAALE